VQATTAARGLRNCFMISFPMFAYSRWKVGGIVAR
jgi:hypothetical protein